MAKGRSHSRSRDDFSIANEPFEPLRSTWLSQPLLDPVHDLRIYHPYRELLSPLELQPVRSYPGQLGRSFSSWDVRSAPASMREVRGHISHVGRINRFGNYIRSMNRQRAIWAFKEPGRVPVCVRRYRRKQVLFAKGAVGRGYRKPRWTERSYMRCR